MEKSFFEKNKILIFAGLFFLLIFFLGNLFLIFFNKNQSQKSVEKEISTVENKESQLTNSEKTTQVYLKTEKQVFASTDEIKIDVYAFSDKKDVLAYDLVIFYDKEGLDILKYQSENANFDVFGTKDEKNGKLFLTFGKKLQSKEPTILDNDKIASLVFKSKKTGNFFVKVIDKFNKETTKFVDINNNILYPETNEIYVNIQ
jgi:hypothetical protein